MDESQKTTPYSLIFTFGIAAFAVVLSFLSAFSPFFVWVVPVPLFLLALNDRRFLCFFLVFLATATGSFSQVFYTYFHTIFPYQRTLLPIGMDAFSFTVILWLASACVHRLKSWYTVFAFPVFWVTYLYLCTFFASNGAIAWLPIFSQIQFLPIVQIVSVIGLLGLSFITCLIPSGFVVSWHYKKRLPKQAVRSLLMTLVLFAIVFGFGEIQLRRGASSPKLKVGLVAQDPRDIETYLATRDKDSILKARDFAGTVSRLAKMGAECILPPENAFWVTPEDQENIFQIIAEAARENKVYVFAPCSLVNRSPERNSVYVFGPDGKLLTSYNKMHLVSPFEDACMPGTSLATIELSLGLAGLEICRDMDFIQPTKEYSKLGVGILFVPARDFGPQADGTWHAEVAILQSIAGGFSLVRSAGSGFLSATDYRGRVLAWQSTKPDKEVCSIVEVPVGSGRTFYYRFGDWFSLLNCASSLAFLVAVMRCRRKDISNLYQ
jgi:apolipoprotein N-acyltransferase